MILFLYRDKLNNDKIEIKAIAKMLINLANLLVFCCARFSRVSCSAAFKRSLSLNAT